MSELGYTKEDQLSTPDKLEEKYGAEGHPVYTSAKYAEALSKNPQIEQNLNGYYDWVHFMCLSDAEASLTADSIVDITDIHQFAGMVSHWHQNMLARLRNLRDIPQGSEVKLIDDATGKEMSVKLKGDGMKGFQAALNAAIAELSQFPFVVSMEDDAANDQSAPQGD